MRVIQVSPYPPETISGINRLISSLASSLAPHGFDLELWCPAGGDVPLGGLKVVPIVLPSSFGRNVLLSLRTFGKLLSEGRDAALIHVHQPHLQSLAALLAARLLAVPGIVTFHVLVPEPRPLSRLGARLLIYLQGKCARRAVVLSRAAARDFGLARCTVIPNGVAIPPRRGEEGEPSPASPDRLEVVFAGRVTRSKGIYVLLEALASARKAVPRLRLTTYGSIDEPGEYEAAKRSLGLQDFVIDRGFDDRWTAALRPGQVFVLPSPYEGMPLSLLEAMASGLYVIATPVGSIPEFVREGETGRLVPVGDPGGLAEALAWAWANPRSAAALGEGARKIVLAGYSLDAMSEAYARLYDELTGRS